MVTTAPLRHRVLAHATSEAVEGVELARAVAGLPGGVTIALDPSQLGLDVSSALFRAVPFGRDWFRYWARRVAEAQGA